MADHSASTPAPAGAGVALFSRRNIVRVHLWLAAFFSPMVIMMAITGGLYLLGVKGTTEATPVALPAAATLDLTASTLEGDVAALLADAGVEHSFEYLKTSGDTVFTRPTSRPFYRFRVDGTGGVTAERVEPSLQQRMMELHMGHGPLLFKDLQKVMAGGLLLVLVTGLWLGISSRGLVRQTLYTSGAGLGLFLLLAFVI